MTTLTIATGYDSKGKRDASCVFLPEARAFQALHGGSYLELVHPNTARNRRSVVEHHIRACEGLDVLAVFGHGTAKKLIATGHGLNQVFTLSDSVWNWMREGIPEGSLIPPQTVIFYSCLTAQGTSGFADHFANALPWANVYAHSTAGHATWNPYIELAGGPNGGDPIFSPREPGWKRWRDRLRDEQGYRLSFWRAGHGLPREQAIEAIREEAVK